MSLNQWCIAMLSGMITACAIAGCQGCAVGEAWFEVVPAVEVAE